MRAALGALLACACATPVLSFGRPMPALPEGIERCDPEVYRPDGGAIVAPEFDTALREAVGDCRLRTELVVPDPLAAVTWKGTLWLGLSSDDTGHVRRVCVAQHDMGEIPRALSCLTARLQGAPFPANREGLWRVVYLLE